MEADFKISSFTLFTSLVGGLFLFAAFLKIIADSIALILLHNDVTGYKDLMTVIWVFGISWLLTTILMYSILPKFFRNALCRTALRIAAIESSILVPLVTFLFSPSMLFGSMEFDFTLDYIDILRNVLIGTIGLLVMTKFTRE